MHVCEIVWIKGSYLATGVCHARYQIVVISEIYRGDPYNIDVVFILTLSGGEPAGHKSISININFNINLESTDI